jgi:hypothetical protein
MNGASGTAGWTVTTGCAAGDTRQCVGRGACPGGQVCDSNGQWSACDCGGQAGGDQGGASAAGSGGAPLAGSSGSATGGAGESGIVGTPGAAGDAASGGGGEAGAAGAGTGADSPCPASTPLVDCSGQCSTAPGLCTQACPTGMTLATANAGDVVVRLPSHPGAPCKCSAGSSKAFSVVVNLALGSKSPEFHLTVPTPWHATSRYGVDACVVPETQCGAVRAGTIDGFNILGTVVWTADPNAPAINVVAEPGPCP